MQDIISKDGAVQAGLRIYFDGEICDNGHLSEKYTETGNCRECAKLRNSFYLGNLNTESIQKRIGINNRKKSRGEALSNIVGDGKELLRSVRRRLYRHKCRDWLVETDKPVTAEEVVEIFDKQNGECAACFVPFTQVGYEIEHIVPLKAFGTNRKENIQLLCLECNRSKNDSHFETWISKIRYEQVIQHLEDLMEEGY